MFDVENIQKSGKNGMAIHTEKPAEHGIPIDANIFRISRVLLECVLARCMCVCVFKECGILLLLVVENI